jgi:hypothetical protein
MADYLISPKFVALQKENESFEILIEPQKIRIRKFSGNQVEATNFDISALENSEEEIEETDWTNWIAHGEFLNGNLIVSIFHSHYSLLWKEGCIYKANPAPIEETQFLTSLSFHRQGHQRFLTEINRLLDLTPEEINLALEIHREEKEIADFIPCDVWPDRLATQWSKILCESYISKEKESIEGYNTEKIKTKESKTIQKSLRSLKIALLRYTTLFAPEEFQDVQTILTGNPKPLTWETIEKELTKPQ